MVLDLMVTYCETLKSKLVRVLLGGGRGGQIGRAGCELLQGVEVIFNRIALNCETDHFNAFPVVLFGVQFAYNTLAFLWQEGFELFCAIEIRRSRNGIGV